MEVIDFKTGERTVYMTLDELNKIINALIGLYNITLEDNYLRDAFIFSFLFWTGVRVEELLLTQKKCVNLEELTYKVPQLKKNYWKRELISKLKKDFEKLSINEIYDKYEGVIKKETLEEIKELIENGSEKEAMKKLKLTPKERALLNLIKYVIIPLDHIPKEHFRIWELYFDEFNLNDNDFLVNVSRRWLHEIIRKHSKEILQKEYFPHALRHSCAVYLHHNLNLDLMDVQAILRHSHLGHTERYARITLKDLKNKIKLMVGEHVQRHG
ncbi:tyrosine-type recombinase/integrase (plasmid) [Methanocaldococcus sp. 16A]